MFFRTKKVASTPFSDFIRKAPVDERKKVYTEVLRQATESQMKVVNASRSKPADHRFEHQLQG